MKCYKLVKIRRDGTIGSLFIHKTERLRLNEWMKAEYYPTKGYAPRFGWHCTFYPYAPHLAERGRVWVECEVSTFKTYSRPESQGGDWILAEELKILRVLTIKEVEELRRLRPVA